MDPLATVPLTMDLLATVPLTTDPLAKVPLTMDLLAANPLTMDQPSSGPKPPKNLDRPPNSTDADLRSVHVGSRILNAREFWEEYLMGEYVIAGGQRSYIRVTGFCFDPGMAVRKDRILCPRLLRKRQVLARKRFYINPGRS